MTVTQPVTVTVGEPGFTFSYGRDRIDSRREMGSYLGYRVGITPSGEWQLFVAGD